VKVQATGIFSILHFIMVLPQMDVKIKTVLTKRRSGV
jgi:hypothetical protein